jgi:hypothetical protein
MFAKKLGRFTAGLFVALGLAFGGAALAAASGSDGASATAGSPVSAVAFSADIDWQ